MYSLLLINIQYALVTFGKISYYEITYDISEITNFSPCHNCV